MMIFLVTLREQTQKCGESRAFTAIPTYDQFVEAFKESKTYKDFVTAYQTWSVKVHNFDMEFLAPMSIAMTRLKNRPDYDPLKDHLHVAADVSNFVMILEELDVVGS